jgi:hypothetical protein
MAPDVMRLSAKDAPWFHASFKLWSSGWERFDSHLTATIDPSMIS